MTDKEKKSKIADVLLEFYEEYQCNIPNRPMIPSLYASKIIDSLQEEPVSVWHDTTDMPDKEKKILVVGFNGEAYAGYYNGVCNPKKIKHWAYIDELLKL